MESGVTFWLARTLVLNARRDMDAQAQEWDIYFPEKMLLLALLSRAPPYAPATAGKNVRNDS